MSGRDLRTFVTSHRVHSEQDAPDKLLRRITNGLASNKYVAVDYEKLHAMAAEKKFSSHKSLIKMKKIEQISKENKESQIQRQHKMVWQKEFIRLNNIRKKAQADLDIQSKQSLMDDDCYGLFQEFEDFENVLSNDFTKFKHNTADPIWALREDLQYWLSENQSELRNGTPEVVDKHAEIRCTIDNVCHQQNGVFDKLLNDQISLERELKMGDLGELHVNPLVPETRLPRDQGIPEEAFDLECPDIEFKASILQEFIIIDEKYLSRLASLEEQHNEVLSLDSTGGWSEDDNFIFQCINDQYPTELSNRRFLLLDRLKKQLPHKTRFDMLQHEYWWLGYKYYHTRRRAVVHDWQRDRRELLNKSRLVLAEACAAYELETATEDCKQKQKEMCRTLYNKVVDWREQKMEVMMLEAKIEQRHQQLINEQLAADREKERKRRSVDKEKIQSFQDERARLKELAEEEDRRRLEDIQRILEEQALFDNERVKYREDQVTKKVEERKERELERQAEEEEKEQRLEALREQVRVIAETDPSRLVKNTEAWRNHLLGEEADVDLQKPLFDVHTFTDKQVISDPRVRLETKLREAGLMQSDYARHVMAKTKPVHPPRRDMESTVFKHDQS